jgi:chaperonin GroEL
MGAMIVRHLAWRVFETNGDGAATAAVLAEAVVRAGGRYIAAGGDPLSVKRGIELGLSVAIAELRRQARAIDEPADIARLVAGTVRRSKLADMIGEAVEAVGTDGAILVQAAQATQTSHEYVDGVRWDEGYISPFLLTDGESNAARVLNPRVLITDHEVGHAEQLLPTLEACVAAGERSLLVVAPEIRDSAVGLLVVNRERGVLDGAIAVRAPSMGTQRLHILEDLAVITGARCISQARHEQLTDVTLDDLGQARQAWATQAAFGVLGGRGSKTAIRQRIAEARAELRTTAIDDVFVRSKIEERIGKLAGTTVIIHVGAPSSTEQDDLKLRIEAAVRAGRAALREGVVPGGGAALLACVPALEELASGLPDDHALGVHALVQALSEPMRTIAANAGFEGEPIVHHARHIEQTCVFDVLRGEWVDPWSAGIVDPLPVVLEALEAGVSAGMTALTAEVLIRRKKPPRSVEP